MAEEGSVQYLCELCEVTNNAGLSSCSDCKLDMCDYCTLGHTKIPATKTHRIIYREGPAPKLNTPVKFNVIESGHKKNSEKTWVKILKTSKNGREVFGCKADLVHAVKRGADFRFFFDSSWGGDEYVSNVQNVSYMNGEVCAQALMHVSKSSWESFQSNIYWFFMNVCTTGHVHISRWLVGSHTKLSEETRNIAVTWFVRSIGSIPEGCVTETLLHREKDGSILSGNTLALSRAVEDGHDIRVLNVQSTDSGYLTPLSCIETNKSLTVGQYPWHISQTNRKKHKEFQNDAYWWFTLWSSDGTLSMSRWSVGSHEKRGNTEAKMEMKWFSDTCWSLQYKHDKSGKAISGSKESLISYVLRGHRVKLVMECLSIESDQLQIKDGHLSAQLLSRISKDGIQRFEDDLCWCWEHVSTDGIFDCVKYGVGDSTNHENSSGTRVVSWFTDTLSWVHALTTSRSGEVTFGNKSDLINCLRDGCMLRYIIKLPAETVVLQADNVNLRHDDFGAQTIRTVSYNSERPRQFQSDPYWIFTIATTRGQVHVSKWTVGKQEFRGSETVLADIEWFICQ